MATYWLTFRLHEEKVSGSSYEQRYKALNDAIDKLSSMWWIEPTSFILFESTQGIDAIAAACKKAIAPTHDVVLLRDLDTKSAVLVGTALDSDVYKLIPYLKKV
jgi:hypothetical protein